jgi:hypothetical protein
MRIQTAFLLAVCVVCCTFPALPAYADDSPKADAAVSYVFLNAIGYGTTYPTGWAASVGWYPMESLGVVGEVGGSVRALETVPGQAPWSASIYNFMVGPKFVLRRNPVVTPFAEALFGGVRLGNTLGGYVRVSAWQFGGGLDVRVKHSFGIRLEADSRLISGLIFPVGPNVKEFRLATGVFISR